MQTLWFMRVYRCVHKSIGPAQIDYPLENVRQIFKEQYVKLLRWFISHIFVSPACPPSSLLSFFFPPIQPFSSCHPWAGGLSLCEVKGQSVGCAGIMLAVSHRPRQMLLNPDLSGSSLLKSVWNAIQSVRPYSGLDFPLEEKRISPFQL